MEVETKKGKAIEDTEDRDLAINDVRVGMKA